MQKVKPPDGAAGQRFYRFPQRQQQRTPTADNGAAPAERQGCLPDVQMNDEGGIPMAVAVPASALAMPCITHDPPRVLIHGRNAASENKASGEGP